MDAAAPGAHPGPALARPAARMPREALAVWALAAAALVAVLGTYAAFPPAVLYHVSGSGIRGGLGRVLVELNFPTALVALAVLATVGGRLPRRALPVAWVAAAGCVVVLLPGVVRESNLDARWVNAVPAAGVALAFTCSLLADGPVSPTRARGDRLRLALAAVLVLLAAPWIAGELGYSLDGVPLLGRIFQTGRIVRFHDAPHPAVHLGVHHGLEGTLLVLVALLLSRLLDGARRPAAQARAFLLSLVLAYGLGNVANDAWLEQVAERGWVGFQLPSVTSFQANWLWLAVLVLTVVVWRTWFGRPPRAAGG